MAFLWKNLLLLLLLFLIAAWVGSAAIALFLFTGHLSTGLIIRFGCRITGLIGGTFCAVSLIASSFVENILVLFFTYSFLFGLGCSCTFSTGVVVISKFFKKRQSLANGVLHAGPGVGVLVMAPTLEALIRASGWQTSYRIMAGVALVLCSLAITFDSNVETDESKNSSNETGEKEDASSEGEDEKMITNVFDISVLKELPVIAFILGACVMQFGHLVPQIHLVSGEKFLSFVGSKGRSSPVM